MTEHLPECPWFPHTHEDVTCRDRETGFSFCEVIAKVRENERSNNFTPDDHANCMTEAYQRGLDAAREAVAAVEHRPTNPATMIRSMALDAIDALRGDK